MAEIAPDSTTVTGIKRRSYGRGHGYTIDGVKAPGVTTILQQVPKPKLVGWAARTTAAYAVDNWGRLAQLPPSKRIAELAEAPSNDRDAAARRGTEVHRLAEALADGREVSPPEEIRGHVESYAGFLDAFNVQPVVIEGVIASRRYGYCGTFDLVADLCGAADGVPAGRWLLDLKTARSGVWPETALQVCAYSRADIFLDPETGREQLLAGLGIEYFGSVHVRADGWDLYPLECGEGVWRYFQRLLWLHYHAEEMAGWVLPAAVPA